MDFIGITGVILGILGIVFAFIFYFKGKKKKKLVYTSESTVLVSEKLSNYEDLKILYNNKEIKSLCSTTIKIKNMGNDIIEPHDLIPSMPITINTSDKFLFQDVSKYEFTSSNSKNRILLNKMNDSQISVNFDFINPKDEITITLLHTGDISIDGDLKQGEVKNYTKMKYETTKDTENSEHFTNINSLSSLFDKTISMFGIMLFVLIVTFIIMKFFLIGGNSDENMETILSILIISSFPLLISLMLMIKKK